ncbi:hypothetical protein [Streptococcus salivarius]|uniref:hypothetical protein n=1 Tax=Streptococcus salivarius TaxID=1304 RepID=UPI00321A9675
MLSKVLSFLLYYPQVVLPVCGGAIAYLSVYKKRPLKTRFLILPILVVITFLLSLIDNPFSDRTYSGLLFVFYNLYVFTPLSVACSITSLLKSIYHYKLFRMPLALVLVINGSIMTGLTILNLILFFGELSTSLILSCVSFILIAISTVVQFVIGEIETRKVKTILIQLQSQGTTL